jgi:hypothetical protein
MTCPLCHQSRRHPAATCPEPACQALRDDAARMRSAQRLGYAADQLAASELGWEAA